MVGAVLSMAIGLTVALALLPARSDTEAAAERAAPSSLTVLSAGQATMPERISLHTQCTITLALYQPLALAARSRAPAMVGFVLSTLIPVTAVAAVLSALSTAVPE